LQANWGRIFLWVDWSKRVFMLVKIVYLHFLTVGSWRACFVFWAEVSLIQNVKFHLELHRVRSLLFWLFARADWIAELHFRCLAWRSAVLGLNVLQTFGYCLKI
jgi:hypothetical protein